MTKSHDESPSKDHPMSLEEQYDSYMADRKALIHGNPPKCTCLTELAEDAYGPGGPMSGKPKPPPCVLHSNLHITTVSGNSMVTLHSRVSDHTFAPSPTKVAIFTPTEEEVEALNELSKDQDLSHDAILRQALRLYQLHHRRIIAGETVTWSGDAQRLRDFAGPLVDSEEGDPVPEQSDKSATKESFDLMQEFYLSKFYDTKAIRRADVIQSAIEFTIHHLRSSPQPIELHKDGSITVPLTQPGHLSPAALKRLSHLERMNISDLVQACNFPRGLQFTFHDEEGEHDPAYVVIPGGEMIPVNGYGDGEAPFPTDVARAVFIVLSCNRMLAEHRYAEG